MRIQPSLLNYYRWLALALIPAALVLRFSSGPRGGFRQVAVFPPSAAATNLLAVHPSGQTPSVGAPLRSRAATPTEISAGAPANLPPNLQRHRLTEEAPQWAVGFGKEFWRRPVANDTLIEAKSGGTHAPLPASLNLGDVIERVHHALGTNAAGTRSEVKARAYTAAFDGVGLRFSPHRPASAVAAGVPPAVELGVSPGGTGRRDSTRTDLSHPDPGGGTPAATPDPATEARFRTLSVRRDGAVLFEIANQKWQIANQWSLLGNTAQSLLNAATGLIEHYEAREEGVAVTWVLERAPAGAGPLVVEAELAGLSYAGQSAQGHHFADAAGTPRVRVGRVTVVDAAGHRWEATTTAAGPRLRVTVPETLLAQATYPLAIDPVVGPEFGMDEPVVRPSSGFQSQPRIAFNGSHYLVIWKQEHYFDDAIYGARITTDGLVLDPQGISISNTAHEKGQPRVAASGNDFLVIWAAFPSLSSDVAIDAARVTGAGEVLDPDAIPLVLDTEDDDSDFDVAGNGTNWLVVWDDRNSEDRSIRGIRVSQSGVVLDAGASLWFGYGCGARVAACGSDYLVVWPVFGGASDGIAGRRISGNGTVLDVIGIASGIHSIQYATVAGSTNGYLVAWNTTISDNGVFAKRLNRDGTIMDPTAITVCHAAQGDFINLAAATAGPDFLVAWDDYHNRSLFDGGLIGLGDIDGYCARVPGVGPVTELCGHFVGQGAVGGVASDGESGLLVSRNDFGLAAVRLGRDGAALEPASRRINFQADRQQTPSVAFNGTNYLVVWADNRNWHPDIFGVRLNPAGMVLDPGGLRISTSPGAELLPAVASNGTNWFVVWEDQRSFDTRGDIYGARVTAAGVVLEPDGRPITTATNRQTRPALACNGRNYLVVWHTFNGPAEAARIDFTGAVLDAPPLRLPGPGIAGATAAASDETDYMVVFLDLFQPHNVLARTYVAFVSGAGVLNSNLVALPFPSAGAPALAWNGQSYLVINGRLGARVAPNGAVLDPMGFPLDSMVTVSASGRDFFVAGSGWGARVGADGMGLGSFLIWPLDLFSREPDRPALAQDHRGRHLLVRQEATPGGHRIVGHLITLDPPVLQPVVSRADATTITWSAYPGRTYRVQFKNNLNAAGWLDLPGNVTADSTTALHTDPAAGASHRFYRVTQLP